MCPRSANCRPISVVEGSTAVATLTAADDDSEASDLTWSIPAGTSGGADASKFTLSTAGVLAFSAAKDYEAPDDTGSDGTYEVTVQVSDGANTDTADLTVTLTNLNEAPTADAGTDQSGIAAGATVTLAGSGTDPDADDTLSYAWTQASGQTVALSGAGTATATFTAPADLAEDATLGFTLQVTDAAGLTAQDSVDIAVLAPQAPPLTARAAGVPASHDGVSAFSFELHFSQAPAISYTTLRNTAFEVTGATINRAGRRAPPSNLSWNITVTPTGDDDVVLVLASGRACNATGAICTTDGTTLSETLTITIPRAVAEQAPPLTARVESVPASHDGVTAFTFELHFSQAPAISYTTLRNTAFEVTGATINRAGRQAPPSNQSWDITVTPTGDDDVVLVLPTGRACTATGAICTADGTALSQTLTITIPGPQ